MAAQWINRLHEREALCRGDKSGQNLVGAHGFGFRLIALLYTIFFFFEPYARHSLRSWLWFAAVYITFVALFLGIPYTRGKLRVVLFMALFALGFAYVPFNESAAGLFVYPMALLPFILKDARRVIAILTIQVAAIVSEGLWLHLSPWSFLMGSFFTIVVSISNLLFMLRNEAAKKLNVAQSEIERLAKTAERERIARDLHDVLGHTLTLVVLKSQVAEQLIASDPARASAEVAEIQLTARKALAEVREAVLGFRSHGLNAEMERARETLATAGIECEQTMLPETLPAMLTREQEMVLTLSVREAVTNVVRHAAAKKCMLYFEADAERVRVRMLDDGKGGSHEGGFGLRGMRERVEMLGGSLSINGASGMELIVVLPMHGQEPAI